jgi:hypothetical protein
MSIRRGLAISVTAGLVTTFALADAASAKTVSPERWAPKFCAALSTWQEELTDEVTEVQDALSGSESNLKARKSRVASFLAKTVATTDRTVAALKKAGSPRSPNGEKIAGIFVKGLQSASDLFAAAKKTVQSIPTNSAAKFKAAGRSIKAAIERGSSEITDSFGSVAKLDTGNTLVKALEAEPSCSFLTG